MDEIRQYMEESILSVKPAVTVTDAAKYMTENNINSLLVEKDGKFTGIITDVDFCQKVIAKDLDPAKTLIGDIKTQPLITLDSDQSMNEAFVCMRKNNIRHLVITEQKKVVGILSMKDFGNYYNYKFEQKPGAVGKEIEEESK